VPSAGVGGTLASGAGGGSAAGAGASAAAEDGGSAGALGAGRGGTGGGGVSAGAPSGGTGPSGGSDQAGEAGVGGAPSEPVLVISEPGDYWRVVQPAVEVASGDAFVTVDDSAPAQTFEGFGGIFHEMGWYYLAQLEPAERERALGLLFGDDGCHLAFGRVPIGASDFALERYTENETDGDYAMEYFSIDRDKEYLIPYIEAARALRPDLRLWASPWTPPTWMKEPTAGSDPASFDRGRIKSDAQTLDAYALYLARFVEEYEQVGLKIESIAPQTDPLIEEDIPSCRFTAETFATFIGEHLGPTFERRFVSATISLSAIGNRDTGTSFIGTVASDVAAKKYIASLGLVWDMTGELENVKPMGLPIHHTQHLPGNIPTLPTSIVDHAPNDHAYGVESWTAMRTWITAGAVAYTAGNLVLDKVGWQNRSELKWAQNALLVVDGGALTITPAYYVFRHVAAFVQPGAQVLPTTGGDALAFKNPDGTSVVVLYNDAEAKKAIVALGQKKLELDLPASGWATLRL
jgi:glucosylceramidase